MPSATKQGADHLPAEADRFVSAHARDYLRLRLIRGIGPRTARQLIAACGSVTALWQMSADERADIEGVSPRLATLLAGQHTLDKADALIESCRAHAIHLLCPEDEAYPRRLGSCDDAPLILFAAGRIEALTHKHMLAVVGARKASREGRLLARRLSRYLSERDICVVSGMAYGIDAAAHGGALEGEGETVAVLGCGLASVKGEMQHQQMQAIAERGCVVSEFLPDQEARPEYFPQRNRIIAGLADGVVVIEADVRSGSLITAGQANGYGRDIMAVPGSPLNGTHTGCHQLIREGATLVESGEQILQQMGWQQRSVAEGGSFAPANAQEAKVHALLQQEVMHIDALAAGCNLTVSELSPILLALELRGAIERLPGSRYTLGG